MHCQWHGIDFVPGLLAFSNLILCHKAFFFCLKAHRSPENMNFLWLFALTQRAYSINSNLKACQLPLQLITCEQLKLLTLTFPSFQKNHTAKICFKIQCLSSTWWLWGRKKKKLVLLLLLKTGNLLGSFCSCCFFPVVLNDGWQG